LTADPSRATSRRPQLILREPNHMQNECNKAERLFDDGQRPQRSPIQIITKMTSIEVRVPVRFAAPVAYSNLTFSKTG
jgi:hypothetical protein